MKSVKSFLKSNFFLLVNICSILAAFFFLINYMKYDILIAHDRFLIFKDIHWLFSQGRFISISLIICFYKILPTIFTQINLNDIQNTILAYFKSFAIIVMTFIYAKAFYLFSPKKSIKNIKSFFITFLILLFILFNNYSPYADSYMNVSETFVFFDWSFNLAFYSLLVYILAKIFINKEFLSGRKFIVCVILAFLVSMTNELYCMSAFILVFILTFIMFSKCYLYEFIEKIKTKLNLIQEKSCNDADFAKKNKRLFSQLLIINIVMFLGGLCYIFSSNYYSLDNWGGYYVNSKMWLFLIQENLKPFLTDFIYIYIKPHLLLYFIIILSIIYIFFRIRNKTSYNLLIFLFATFTGLFLFLMALILGGPVSDNEFFLNHYAIIYSYVKTIILICIFLVGYILNSFFNKRGIINISNVVALLIFFAPILLWLYKYITTDYFISYCDHIKQMKRNREISYVSDKISLIVYKYDGMIKLPIDLYKNFSNILYLYDYSHPSKQALEYYTEKIREKEEYRNRSRIFTFDDYALYKRNDDKTYDNKYLVYIRNLYDISPNYMVFLGNEELRKWAQERNIDFNISKEELKRLRFSDIKIKPFSLNELNEIILKNPEKSWSYAARGRYYYLRNEYKKAIEDYTKAIDLKEDMFYYLLRAGVYRDSEDIEKALKDYTVVMEYDNLALLLSDNIAKLMLETKKYKDAVDVYSRLIEIYPYGIKPAGQDNYYKRGEIKQLIGDYKGAVKDFEESEEINIYSFVYEVNYNIAELQYKLKNYKDAIANCTEEIQNGNDSAKIYYLKGLSYIKLKKWNQAIDSFINCLEKIEYIDNKTKGYVKGIKKYIKLVKVYDSKNKYEGIEKIENILKDNFSDI